MRQRRIPEAIVAEVYNDPDGSFLSSAIHGPDRQVRWRRYDDQVVEIVVDLLDGSVVSAWITQVNE
jgi:hypothetical protein